MVGPNFQRPEPPRTERYTETPVAGTTTAAPGAAGKEQRLVSGADLPAQWWTLFRSEPLDKLIRDALAESPNLAAAQAALKQARENLAAETGARLWPRVDANASATREKISGAATGVPQLGTSIFNLYNASVDVSYTLDISGGARRELEGLQALVDYQNFQLDGAHLALTSNIVTAAVQEAALRAQVCATQEIVAALEKQLD